MKDQTITVSGMVAAYRGNPQIQLTQPEQLKIENPPREGESQKKKPSE